MTKKRQGRENRRNLNSQEMHDMGYVDLRTNADEDVWAYPDDDGEETTENYLRRGRSNRNDNE